MEGTTRKTPHQRPTRGLKPLCFEAPEHLDHFSRCHPSGTPSPDIGLCHELGNEPASPFHVSFHATVTALCAQPNRRTRRWLLGTRTITLPPARVSAIGTFTRLADTVPGLVDRLAAQQHSLSRLAQRGQSRCDSYPLVSRRNHISRTAIAGRRKHRRESKKIQWNFLRGFGDTCLRCH